jgi:hypothetical protein
MMFDLAKAIIPATVPTIAVFRCKDGTEDRLPVLAWALIDETFSAVDDYPEATYSRLVGMVMVQGEPSLMPVDEDIGPDTFLYYDYPLGTRAP